MKNRELFLPAFKTAFVFLILGYLWVFVTDHVLHMLMPFTELEYEYQTYKGWFFITVTALLIFFIFRRQLKRIVSYKNKGELIKQGLQRSEAKYRALFEGINDAVFVHPLMDEGFARFVEVNEIACKRLGYTKEELLKLSPKEISAPEDVKLHAQQESRKSLMNQEWQVFETVHIAKDGKRIPVEISSRVFELEGRRMIMSLARDISRRKRNENEMKRRIEFERLVNEISTGLVGVNSENFNDLIQHILASIGKFTRADRAYVFRFRNGEKLIDNTHEWCAEGVAPQINILKDIVIDEELPWFIEHIRKDNVFHVSDIESLPPEAKLEYEHFKKQNIKSLICVPMETGGHLLGFLGFDNVRESRLWTTNEQSLLRFVSQSVSSAIKRLQAEEALKESEEKFRLIAENSIDVIWKTDLRLRFTYLSPSLFDNTGFLPEEWIGTPLWEHTSWPVFAKLARTALEFIRNPGKHKTASLETVIRDKSGKEFPIEIIGKPLFDAGGKVVGLQGVARDITDRMNHRLKLENSEKKYRLLFQTNPVPLIIVDTSKLVFIDVNKATEKLLGYRKKELLKMHLWDVRPEISVFTHEEIQKILFSASHEPIEAKLVTKEGKTILVEPNVDIINYEGKKAALVAFNDITSLKAAEKRIIQSIIEGEDNERKRISKEIHDSLGQNLTAASLNFDAIRQSVARLGEKENIKFTTGLYFLNTAIEESRNIAHNVMPKAIDDFGLIPSLKSLFNIIMKSTGINVKLYENLGDRRLNKQTELNLYRITQEALNNVIKHARAKEIFIQLILHQNEIIYTFEDDGVGFDKSLIENSNKGMGLKSIFNRVIALAGTFELDTAPGRGTSLTIELPIEE